MTEPVPADLARRLWRREPSLWQCDAAAHPDIVGALGWLDSAAWSAERLPELTAWVEQIWQCRRIRYVVLLAMGGGSLAPAVFAALQPPGAGLPELIVLDSTSPAAVLAVRDAVIDRALFVVSSKSGLSIETDSLLDYFYARVARSEAQPGARFVAITDQDSRLHLRAGQLAFGKVFLNQPEVGGRYSALNYAGLVPAALIGVDLRAVLERAADAVAQTRADAAERSPALVLGRMLGQAWLDGADKLCLQLPPVLHSLGLWIEQLIAESTGKSGKGFLPLTDAAAIAVFQQRADRVLIRIECGTSMDGAADVRWRLEGVADLGAEFFRWQFATAAAAVYMRVNPFDQPDVAQAKLNTRRVMQKQVRLALTTCERQAGLLLQTVVPQSHAGAEIDSVAGFLANVRAQDYVAILAYLPDFPPVRAALNRLQRLIARRFARAVTVAFGPRYLHSTGQLHKGGPACGHFLQIIEPAQTDVAIPQRRYSFAELIRAQADGDLYALQQKHRPLIRAHLNGDRLAALHLLCSAVAAAEPRAV